MCACVFFSCACLSVSPYWCVTGFAHIHVGLPACSICKAQRAVALETAFLPWHSRGPWGVADYDMAVRLWCSQGGGGSQALLPSLASVHMHGPQGIRRCSEVSRKLWNAHVEANLEKKATWLCRCALGTVFSAPLKKGTTSSRQWDLFHRKQLLLLVTGGHSLRYLREYPGFALHNGMLAATLYFGVKRF